MVRGESGASVLKRVETKKAPGHVTGCATTQHHRMAVKTVQHLARTAKPNRANQKLRNAQVLLSNISKVYLIHLRRKHDSEA